MHASWEGPWVGTRGSIGGLMHWKGKQKLETIHFFSMGVGETRRLGVFQHNRFSAKHFIFNRKTWFIEMEMFYKKSIFFSDLLAELRQDSIKIHLLLCQHSWKVHYSCCVNRIKNRDFVTSELLSCFALPCHLPTSLISQDGRSHLPHTCFETAWSQHMWGMTPLLHDIPWWQPSIFLQVRLR